MTVTSYKAGRQKTAFSSQRTNRALHKKYRSNDTGFIYKSFIDEP